MCAPLQQSVKFEVLKLVIRHLLKPFFCLFFFLCGEQLSAGSCAHIVLTDVTVINMCEAPESGRGKFGFFSLNTQFPLGRISSVNGCGCGDFYGFVC